MSVTPLIVVNNLPLMAHLGEGIDKVPGKGKHGNPDSNATDHQSTVHQTMVLKVGQLFSHNLQQQGWGKGSVIFEK